MAGKAVFDRKEIFEYSEDRKKSPQESAGAL